LKVSHTNNHSITHNYYCRYSILTARIRDENKVCGFPKFCEQIQCSTRVQFN